MLVFCGFDSLGWFGSSCLHVRGSSVHEHQGEEIKVYVDRTMLYKHDINKDELMIMPKS